MGTNRRPDFQLRSGNPLVVCICRYGLKPQTDVAVHQRTRVAGMRPMHESRHAETSFTLSQHFLNRGNVWIELIASPIEVIHAMVVLEHPIWRFRVIDR